MALTEKEKARHQKRRKQRREAGECPNCGNQPGADKIICQTCLDKETKRRSFKKYLGLCTSCGTRSPYSPILGEDKKTCPTCLTNKRMKRQELNRKGLCICGNQIKSGSVSSCQNCLERQAINAKKYRAKARRKIKTGRSWSPTH